MNSYLITATRGGYAKQLLEAVKAFRPKECLTTVTIIEDRDHFWSHQGDKPEHMGFHSFYIETLINGIVYDVIELKPDQKTYKILGAGQAKTNGNKASGYYKIVGATTLQNNGSAEIRVCENPFEQDFNEGWILKPKDVTSLQTTEFYVKNSAYGGKLELE
jgi:hypothetical protein